MFKLHVDNFKDLTTKNFSMRFANAYTVSLAMGDSIYCTPMVDDGETFGYSSVEVAAWDSNGNWVKLGDNDDVAGWVSADDVLAIMNKVAAL